MKRVLLMTVAGLVVASSAMAANEQVRFALHAKAQTTKTANICTTYSPMNSGLPCTNYNVQWPLGSASQTYLVAGFGELPGIIGVDFGIDYSSTDALYVDWTWCTDGQQFPSDPTLNPPAWPQPGSSNIITWVTCQTGSFAPAGVHAMMGAFYLYAYSNVTFNVTPNTTKQGGVPVLAVTTCGGGTRDLVEYWTDQGHPEFIDLMTGTIGFGSSAGYNPCLTTPAAATTWGKIKSQYSN